MSSRPRVISSAEPLTVAEVDAVLVGAFSDDVGASPSERSAQLDSALEGHLTKYLRDSGFRGAVGDLAIVPTLGQIPAKSIAVAGLGPREKAGTTELRRAAGAAARRLSERATLATDLHRLVADSSAATSAVTEGLLLGSYRFTAYKSDRQPTKLATVSLLEADPAAIERGATRAEATLLARDLANEPPSSLTPTVLADRARALAEETGLECTIYDEDELRQKGLGGILAVGRGSSQPPRLIRLHHNPPAARARVALVGKGITFDSGGLSLKDAKGMETMKTDMSGAGAVIAAVVAAARLEVPVEVIAYAPATENMPGPNAIKPGDVIEHYGGRTTEVLNTDAEGRLVLADALVLASEESPDAIVDVATLTGSVVVALGESASGLFCNDDELARRLQAAADSAGERVWRMPLYEDYKKQLESEVADQKNVAGNRWGGSIVAACFLQPFVGNGIPWAHLDIAGPARIDRDADEISKGGTGVAVRTLVSWIEGLAR